MRLPGETTCSGECIRLVGPRSYKVRVGNTEYILNKQQLIPTGKPSESNELPEIVDQSIEQRDNESEDMATSQPPEPATVRTPDLRHSERVRQAPSWTKDYVPSNSVNFFFIFLFFSPSYRYSSVFFRGKM